MSDSDALRRRRGYWIGGYLAAGCVFGLSGVVLQPMTVHFELAKFFASMSATLFGILGIWIAVLDPKTLLSFPQQDSKADNRELLQKLLGPWLNVTAVFMVPLVLTAIFAFLLPRGG